jgi:hypothetical protein
MDIGDVVPLLVYPPGTDVTVYDVIGKLPLSTGGENDTSAVIPVAPVLAADTLVGAPGTDGITLLIDNVLPDSVDNTGMINCNLLVVQ